MTLLPERPSARRVVVVLSERDYDALSLHAEAEAALFDRGDLAVMRWPAEPNDPLAMRLEDRGVATPGVILLQSPYDTETYVAEADAADYFALEKASNFSHLCLLLGARVISVEVVADESTDETLTAEARAERIASGSIKGKSTSLDRLTATMTWKATSSGNDPDVPAAEQFLQSRHVDGDPVFSSLVRARAYPGNRLESQAVTVDLSRESRRTLEIAASLKIPLYLEASATFTKHAVAESRYRVDYNVEF